MDAAVAEPPRIHPRAGPQARRKGAGRRGFRGQRHHRLGTHVGTHIDALAHVSQGVLYGSRDAADEQRGGRFMTGGVQDVAPIFCRGVLLDVPGALGMQACPPAFEITPAHLEAAVERQGTAVGEGEVVLVRSGWTQRWSDRDAYTGAESGSRAGQGDCPVAGRPWCACRWGRHHPLRAPSCRLRPLFPPRAPCSPGRHSPGRLRDQHHRDAGPRAVGGEVAYEFTFALSPLHLVGATGPPVRPLAIVAA